MSKVMITTVIGERVFTAEVDREELAKDLQFAARGAKYVGARPGEPSNITHTSSDPISREKFHTLMFVYESLSANQD
jgi:hypothetical protein